MANHYDPDDFVAGHLLFKYNSYVDSVSEKKIGLLSVDGIIEGHWVK